MSLLLNGCFSKVNRAREHLEQLKQERAEVGTTKFLRADFEAQGRARIARLRLVSPLPSRISSIVGDCVHNLRSALDHLACSMVEVCGGKVTRQTQFPVCNDESKFEEVARQRLPGVDSRFLDLVKKFQPYAAAEPSSSPLDIIHRLDIQDKHRGLLVAAFLPASVHFEAHGPEGSVEGLKLNKFIPFPLRDGDELLRFGLVGDVDLKDLKIIIKFGAELALVEAPPVHGQSIVFLLHNLSEFILREVLVEFAPLIEGS